MKTAVVHVLGALLATLLLTTPAAAANKYPPGPGGTCLDSVTVYQIQNSAATCHPLDADTVLGMGGIVVGINPKTSNGAKVYIANNPAGPWQGVQLFNGNTLYPSLAVGDSVVWEFGIRSTYRGETEVLGYGGNFSPVQKLNVFTHGNPVPMHTDNAAQFQRGFPNANPNADQWEGSLVKCTGPLRAARQMGANAWLMVDHTVCPPSTPPTTVCDSVYVDGYALLPAGEAIVAPAVGTIIPSVIGVYGIDNRALPSGTGWKIQLRTPDIEICLAPTPGAAYSVHNDTIRVKFDRTVTAATGEDVNNYQMSDLSNPVSATLEADGKAVNLYVPAFLSLGAAQSVTVSGLTSDCGLTMGAPVTLNFFTGVLAVHDVRISNPDSLAGTPCLDKSRFAGAGSAVGGVMTVRGTCIGAFGANPYIQDNATGLRTGIQCYTASFMQLGHRYLMVGGVQEYNGETEVTNLLYARDEGVAANPPVTTTPIINLRTEACNQTPVLKDYMGQLVKLEHVVSTANVWRFPGAPHTYFYVAGPAPTIPDTIEIGASGAANWSQAPDSCQWMDITGVVRYDNRYYTHGTVNPRQDSDFIWYAWPLSGSPCSHTDVPTSTVNGVSFAVHPNPARIVTVGFALPKSADVDLAVFDLSGRRIATLARGAMEAGKYARAWNGAGVGSGVYFVRLRAGAETYTLRAVSIQ